MKNIYWAGDSTVQYNDITTYPQTGIGQVMHLFVKPETEVSNHAKNGRSTKSFIDEGRLNAISERIDKGDFLFIQFGHNDEKIKDPTRYTEPFSSFKDNLRIFIGCAREKGAYPILITPVERRCFDENGVLGAGEHTDYVLGMKQVAEEENVPCIDLYTESRKILTESGAEAAAELHVVVEPGIYPGFADGKDDHTHLNYKGAVKYASVIAAGLYSLGGIYRELLVEAFIPKDWM